MVGLDPIKPLTVDVLCNTQKTSRHICHGGINPGQVVFFDTGNYDQHQELFRGIKATDILARAFVSISPWRTGL